MLEALSGEKVDALVRLVDEEAAFVPFVATEGGTDFAVADLVRLGEGTDGWCPCELSGNDFLEAAALELLSFLHFLGLEICRDRFLDVCMGTSRTGSSSRSEHTKLGPKYGS